MTNVAARPGLLQRGLRTLRDQGPLALAMGMLALGVHRRLALVERSVLDDLPRARDELEVTTSEIADPEEVFELRPGARRAVFERHLHSGAVLFGARHRGRLVAAHWVTCGGGWVEYVGRALAAARDECYIADTYTHPDFRGRGVNVALLAASLRHVRGSGTTTALAGVLPENHAGMQTALRLGFRVTGRIGWTGVGTCRRYFATRTTGPITWAPRRPL